MLRGYEKCSTGKVLSSSWMWVWVRVSLIEYESPGMLFQVQVFEGRAPFKKKPFPVTVDSRYEIDAENRLFSLERIIRQQCRLAPFKLSRPLSSLASSDCGHLANSFFISLTEFGVKFVKPLGYRCLIG
ncbi:hypothetical protein V6N12_057943 [Hibiscus sabdariffa]|uniref:Uncharacterized protein n=1 Tax=Hibiscus sabdariffa TaxID=183260 RepID=A0ABR2AEI1_9ROSI